MSYTPDESDVELFGRMMKAIHTKHEFGNKVRMLKLPLILTDTRLYAAAIAQFYLLTKTLERRLDECKGDALVDAWLARGYKVTPGYESDLQEILGVEWHKFAEDECTPATRAYCETLETSSSIEVVGAAFILYGALVIGGGKATQRKVRKVFPACKHQLFDVAEDMVKARREFKEFFNGVGKESPEHADALVSHASRFMALNNTVILSARCLPFWWWRAVAASATVGAVFFAMRWQSSRALTAA
eukprot:TRINITY_DN21568_c0_g1_i2.p1 TRINITY_DN21568_c0_g1~~TRINITY_DN21568_c0_g1_i2.p1  ORF type:complete len:245 (-),score=50.74 TRINITY_DN21568_c0_g1_i2:85-819(-)